MSEDVKHKFLLLNGNSLEVLKSISDNTVHTVVTSPPYWQLRDYQVSDQLGQESTPEEYVEKLVAIMAEVRRVLRKDGTCWFNIGDGYNNSAGYSRAKKSFKRKGREKGSGDKSFFKHDVIKRKDLIGMPWRLAFALQESGWYLRCDVVWKKENPMPDGAKDRPTRGHEYIFLFTKSEKYFYDYYGVLEDTKDHPDGEQGFGANVQEGTFRQDKDRSFQHFGKRNPRSVWETSVANFKGGHYATFPEKLINTCVKAGTSEKGCCVECGTPWARKFEKEQIKIEREIDCKGFEFNNMFKEMGQKEESKLYLVEKGWEKKCTCDTDETKPCIVLDPFSGMATTGLVAFKFDQHYLGIELNEKYLEASRDRLQDGYNNVVVEVESVEEL
jgi:DNA modification methylase